VGLAGAAALVVACASLWIYRLDLARIAAGRLLAQSGLRASTFTIDRLDLSGLQVRNVAFNDGAIGIDELTLTYTPMGLASGMVDSATIQRPRIALVSTSEGIMVGDVALLVQPPADVPAAAAPIGWRIATIKLVEAEISLDTPTGPMRAVFSTDLSLSGTDIQRAGLSLDISAPIGGANHRLHIVAPSLALTSRDGSVTLSFAQVDVAPKDIPWTVEELGGEIIWRPDALIAKLTSGRLRDTRNPASVTPIVLTGDATMRGAKIDFTINASVTTHQDKAALHVKAVGAHDRASGRGSARVTSTPTTFQIDGLQPRDFLPMLGEALPKLAGSVSLGGMVSWRGAAISPALILHLADVGAELQGASLRNIHGDVAISGIWPLATPAGQSLQGIIEAGGLPPSQISLVFQFLAEPALRVETLRTDFVGGKISASPFTLDPAHPDLETTIDFSQIDLAEFFKLVSVDGLGGSGKLDGQIPLQLRLGKIIVLDGALKATGPGVLRLGTDVLPKQITEAGESVSLVLKALADFHYDSLAVDLAGNAAGEGTIMLKIQGQNPVVLEGQAFNLNIKLETNFDRLIDIALRTMQAAQELLRQTSGSTQR
jgi:hypothetical protein